MAFETSGQLRPTLDDDRGRLAVTDDGALDELEGLEAFGTGEREKDET